jgi:3-deoxy-manno-octulosonate cytidylyltransferase (CMP-KDO synthetase)
MIAHVYERARLAHGVDDVIVATDDPRIAAAVDAFGGSVRMTRTAHRTGTDRIAEVAQDLACDIVVNPQGDEPLLDPRMIEDVVRPLVDDPSVSMTTLRRPITDPADYVNPHVVKVTVDSNGNALYFSRAPIPAAGAPGAGAGLPPCHAHVGLYAFRREFLLRFAALPRTPLEQIESLEQLRALEHGYRIRTVATQHATVGVDTPEDLERAREHLLARQT